MFNKIEKWYQQDLWTAEMVQKAVEKGILTVDEAGRITRAQGD